MSAMQGLEPLTHSYMLQLQFPVVLQGTGGVYFDEMAYHHARTEATSFMVGTGKPKHIAMHAWKQQLSSK